MIKNIIFDVGNVFVRWSPPDIIERCFGHDRDSDENLARAEALFRGPLWRRLNMGEVTQAEAALAYQAEFGLSAQQTDAIFFHVTDHQEPIEGTEALARRLKDCGYQVFALTDNVHEVVAYLKSRHQFWPLFEGAVVSAEIGLMKPDPAIFRHAIEKFGLVAAETVFLDDIEANVAGARSVGMEARLFTTASRCEDDLRTLGLAF
jgi:putative hydrolase of the HAD superfamily